MKNLLKFKEITLLSKVEKAARTIEFGPDLNLLIGQNDVGKSTIIKSLYHSLGANVPQLNNARWKNARPIYTVKFEIGSKTFTVVRDERYFGVFDESLNLISKHKGIASDTGIAHFINKLLNFRVELERKANSTLGLAGPAYYFLPFYIDQDHGWNSSWESFDSLQQFKDYRKNMLEYHLGIRPQSYYDTKRQYMEIEDELKKAQSEKSVLQKVWDNYHKRKVVRQVEIDPALFKKEIEELVDSYNALYARQQSALQVIKNLRSERGNVDSEIALLRKAISELDADYSFAESPETPDHIDCPTCGSEIENSIVERFGILDDIDYCHQLVDQWMKRRLEIQERLSEAEELYKEISKEAADVNALLHRQKENVTFSEIIRSQGINELLQSMTDEIKSFENIEESYRERMSNIEPLLQLDASRKKDIVAFYRSRMKEFLNLLNVHVLSEDDYKTLDRKIKENALGSDLPRSLLAQYFAFLHTKEKFNQSTLCPMIIDSPLQQEQDDANTGAIFDFIFQKTIESQQLIMGTLNVDIQALEQTGRDLNVVELDQKLHVLSASEYDDAISKVGPLHEQTLSS